MGLSLHKKKFDSGIDTDPDTIAAFLGKEISLSGKLDFQGTSLRIDGKFDGEIDASGTLIVGEGAKLTAKIKIDKIVIMGEVKGTVDARERLEVQGRGNLIGDIKTPNLVVADGATFDGNCVMSGKPKESGVPYLVDKKAAIGVEKAV